MLESLALGVDSLLDGLIAGVVISLTKMMSSYSLMRRFWASGG